MAKSDILGNAAEELAPGDDPDWEWMVAKSLLDASAHSTRAFEQHLLRTYRADASGSPEEVREHLERAIDEHERIIEHLELAARAVDEIDAGNSPDTT